MLNFLNAVLSFDGREELVDIGLAERELDPEGINDKLSRLDILGKANDGSIVNSFGKRGAPVMPLLSMFYSIILRMYNNGEHNPPHFHAYYGEYQAVFNFDGDLIGGAMPRKQTRLIQAWTEIHVDELMANWELAMNEEPIFRIDPLK